MCPILYGRKTKNSLNLNFVARPNFNKFKTRNKLFNSFNIIVYS